MYLFSMYTPSNDQLKAVPVSKINSNTSFNSKLFKVDSNFKFFKIKESVNYYFYHYLCIYAPSN